MAPSKTTLKRINKEIADLQKEDIGEILLNPNESDIHQWTAWMPGPDGGPYDGGQFELQVTLPTDYPFSPPKVRFLTPIYHCNVNSSGGICLDILKNNWSPALSLYKVILSLSALLCDPNPSDPLVGEIAAELKRNKPAHDKKAKEHTEKHAASVTNLAKREKFKQSLLESGKYNKDVPPAGPSKPKVIPGPPPKTAQGRPVAGTQRVASSTSVNSDAVVANMLAPPLKTTNKDTASPSSRTDEQPSTDHAGVAGTRRTAAEIVDITDDADGADTGSRRVKRKPDGPGQTTDDAIVVD